MHSEKGKHAFLEVETEDTVYEIEFGQIQIEITGRCNMLCDHCRASQQPRKDMPLEQIVKIIHFARQFSPNYKEVIVSGGEPLLHRDFAKVLRAVRENGGDFVTLTTNGSVLRKEHLDLIESLAFERMVLSVSVDSLKSEEHDAFRHYEGAFASAIDALRLVAERNIHNVTTSMRATLHSSQIGDMGAMIEFAQSMGCSRVSFSSILPAGRALARKELWMTREEKLAFITNLYLLKRQYPHMNITTNDPLKCILRGASDVGGEDELVFDGCGAAAITFNVNADGVMTPCALLNIPMMEVFPLSIDEMTEKYRANPIVRNMLAMNLGGKCGTCSMKYQCGGCRARAFGHTGDYLAEDPDCWL
jgi:radical SAM protein with 4Fe4S-binding SPASM domain